MTQAMEKVAFLPFGYLIDKWRWKVFDGTTTSETYNSDWWKLRYIDDLCFATKVPVQTEISGPAFFAPLFSVRHFPGMLKQDQKLRDVTIKN